MGAARRFQGAVLHAVAGAFCERDGVSRVPGAGESGGDARSGVSLAVEGQSAVADEGGAAHRRQGGFEHRISLMAKQIGVFFDFLPEKLDDFVLASQISQAEALKFFIERMRIGKWRRTGILWWNLRDGWPVISDAVVDYYGRRKLAYAYVERVQRDVCVMCGEAEGGRHALVTVNDTLAEVQGTVTIREAGSGRELAACAYRVSPNGVATVSEVPAAARPEMWLIEWTCGGERRWNHYLAGPRPFSLRRYAGWMGAMHLPGELAAVQQAAAAGA